MHCRFFNEISDEWVYEKLSCINHNELRLAREIDELFKSKCEIGPRYFTAIEFSKILKWKGLAKIIPAFLERYNNIGEVEKITKQLFKSKLQHSTFIDINDKTFRQDIVYKIDSLFYHLHSQLRYVGKAVASACLALCFPNICVTADYIVPGLLHNTHDNGGNENPLFQNAITSQQLRQALIMPMEHSLSAYAARNIATDNYIRYVREFWNIKRIFGLTEDVRKIEAAIWSFGMCYFRKWPGYSDTQPLTFKYEPNPPMGGLFSKICPNEPGLMI